MPTPMPIAPRPAGRPLRKWQRAAAEAVLSRPSGSFVASGERPEIVTSDASARIARFAAGEPHRAIHARVNRATGAPSVSDATADQLENGNHLLATEAR